MPGCLHDRCGKPASALKDVYLETRNLRSYLTLCERFVLTPLDCEKIATLLKTKKRFTEALTWVERGLKAEGQRNWHNESSHTLRFLKQELLAKVGRREEALQQAWKDFIVAPSKDGYDDLMRYASKGERQDWHRRALGQAERSGLWGFIDICVKTREWERLAGRVLAVGDGELEGLSHYTTEPAAKGLVRKSPEAAAKLYRALAMRILKAGKSKYYAFALEHLRTARRLYRKLGRDSEWDDLVAEIRREHSRKRGIMGALENTGASATPPCGSSFAQRARQRWKEHTS